MNLREYLERFGKAVFEKPVGLASKTDEPPELAEVRIAILDQIRDKSYRAGGKKVFPFNVIRVHLRGVEPSRADLFRGRFFRQYLENEIRTNLANSDVRHPEDIRTEIEVATTLPQPGEQWLWVEAESQDNAPDLRTRPAKLVVVEGAANMPEMRLDKARINIGRTVDVYRSEGLFRRNDLAFPEDTEINRTVSREHAHILFEKSAGEYRLFNDRWYQQGSPTSGDCGTWIVRDGMSQEVHRGSRGTKLQPGDQIHFGRAIVVFDLAE